MREKNAADTYARYCRIVAGEPLPTALVDLEALEANARRLEADAHQGGKTLRLASKSVRVPALLKRLLAQGAPTTRGLMTYAASETAFLAGEGFDDLLLAYPTASPHDARALAEAKARGATVRVVCDAPEQLDALEAGAAGRGIQLDVLLELDTSWRPLGASVHIGARRSPIRTPAEAVVFARATASRPHLSFAGVMAYESHIAGVTDASPFSPLMNGPKRAMKLLSRGAVASTRAAVVQALAAAGFAPLLVNGGGTGSLHWAKSESALTEVTVGSGYLDSHLFSYYRDLRLQPAAFFALQVVRQPAPGIVTCHGGGYVASGEAGPDRLPLPALPAGARLLEMEGAGEVQTPVVLPAGVEVPIGAPIFFRHAKAGELAEHFNAYLLVEGEHIVERVPTYRGLGRCFLG